METVDPAQEANRLQNVLVGGTLVDLRLANNVPVRVMNASNQSRRVRKGMDNQLEKNPSLIEEKSNVPMHLQDLFERSKRNLDEAQQNKLKNCW